MLARVKSYSITKIYLYVKIIMFRGVEVKEVVDQCSLSVPNGEIAHGCDVP